MTADLTSLPRSGHTADSLPDELFVDAPTDAAGSRTLSLGRAPMVRLGIVANRYRQLTSQRFRSSFGIGATDWRMLVMLSAAPGATVADIAATTGLDKAAVSRSLAVLRRRGHVTDAPSPHDRRRQHFSLTAAGTALHAAALSSSLQLNRATLAGFDEADVTHLNRLFDRLLANLAQLDGRGEAPTP